MEIDIYQQCPCYSGKKVKFCCGKDIVTDLNQILAKCKSNQSLSALDQIESVIARSGERDCLLTLQTYILFVLGDIVRAGEVNRKFAARNPRHPIALQFEAMTILAAGHLPEAIDKLQDAMDALKSNEIPMTMALAFRMVGSVLLQTGNIIAARAHFLFAALIRGEEASDDELGMIQQTFRIPGVPLAFKTEFRLEPTPEGRNWSGKYENVIRAVNRGQFRLGLRILERIDAEWPDQKEVLRSIAIARMMLANQDRIAAAWHRLSELDSIPRWQAVEARALSYIFEVEDPSGTCEDVAATVELSDLDSVYRAAASSSRMVEVESPGEDYLEEGPPPRHAFQVLDRDRVQSLANLRADQIPRVISSIFLYGRQTDRNSRLRHVATKNSDYESAMGLVKSLFGEFMVSEFEEAVISTYSNAEDVLEWQWHIPAGTTRREHFELINEYRRQVLVEKWVNIPFSCLDSLTPLQASQRPDLSLAVDALLLNLEQSMAFQLSDGADITALRHRLGIAEPEKLDAKTLDDALVTPLTIRNIDPKTLSAEQLQKLFGKCISVANTAVLRTITLEILSRDSMAKDVPRDICWSMLAQITEDEDQSLEYLAKARHEVKHDNTRVGMYLVQELEFRMSRGLTEKLPNLILTIRNKYLGNTEVELQLQRVMMKFGLITADGMINLPKPSPDERVVPESVIWTPDSAMPLSASAGDRPASKIWVPGSD